MKTVFFRLIICLITLTILESCSILGIEKITIRQSEFTYNEIDMLFQGKLNFINVKNDENIIFPIRTKKPKNVEHYIEFGNRRKFDDIVEYQPTILFLTKDRFILNMGCTIYGQLSKGKENSFDIVYTENSNDCGKKELDEIEILVVKTLKASNKCIIENNIITFKRDNEVLMVYNII
jgi:hypothetical protein